MPDNSKIIEQIEELVNLTRAYMVTNVSLEMYKHYYHGEIPEAIKETVNPENITKHFIESVDAQTLILKGLMNIINELSEITGIPFAKNIPQDINEYVALLMQQEQLHDVVVDREEESSSKRDRDWMMKQINKMNES